MTVYSLVQGTIDQGAWTGTARFDRDLRKVFPRLKSITPGTIPDRFEKGDVVICDNHLALRIPNDVEIVIVHHGCAATHYERDPEWRNPTTRLWVAQQKEMARERDAMTTTWAPSAWVADEFSRHNPDWFRTVVVCPNWVPTMELRRKTGSKVVVIGDWRDNNKGQGLWKRLQASSPLNWEFRTLRFQNDKEKYEQYSQADAYLCLSVSEGGSYSMADAEAAGLPIVTTNVGNYREFKDSYVIKWDERDNYSRIYNALRAALDKGRRTENFYTKFTFRVWEETWKGAIECE